MTPIEQTAIMFLILAGIGLVFLGAIKGIGWLWKTMKAWFSKPAVGAVVLITVAAGGVATLQQKEAAQQQVERIEQRGIKAEVVTIDETKIQQIIRAAQREGLQVTTHTVAPPQVWGAPNPLYVIEGEAEDLGLVVEGGEPEENEPSAKNGFVYGLEGIDY